MHAELTGTVAKRNGDHIWPISKAFVTECPLLLACPVVTGELLSRQAGARHCVWKKPHTGWGHPGDRWICPGELWICSGGDSNEVKSNLIKSPIPYFSFPGLRGRKEEASFQSWLTDSPQACIIFILEPAEPFIFSFLFLSFAQEGDKHLTSSLWHHLSTKAA